MNRVLGIILLGLVIIPSGVLAGSVAIESGKKPSDCQHRALWLQDTITRYTVVEGASHDVDRYSGTSVNLSRMADAYAKSATDQLASNPPASDSESNRLIAQYFQWVHDNWTGWVSQRYYSTHTDLELTTQSTQIHDALVASETHCG